MAINIRWTDRPKATEGSQNEAMQANWDISEWLRELDLTQYEQAFRDNAVDVETLPELNEADLEKLGVLLGHRKKMLRAIAALREAAPISASIPTLSRIEGAERRQLTVVFCDLVASTDLSTRLDPEDLREVLASYAGRVTQEVRRFGGFVARFLGDGILAYFGYPQAREDDPERALRAGLATVGTVSELEMPFGALQARVGIATGLVVVGDLTDGAGQEHEVVGETPNLAARLQSLAEPNSVLVAPTTRQLVGDLFEFHDLGAFHLKGFAAPVQVWRLVGPGRVHSRFEALRTSSLTPLVGREDELDLLSRRWRRVKEGDGQILLLAGEAGIGKSRILAAFEASLQREPHLRLPFFCSPNHHDSTFYPLIAQIERAAGFAREDTPEAKLDKLEALLSEAGESSPEEAALFAELVGLPTAGRFPPPALDPQRRRELTLAAFVRQLEARARRLPVFLIFDDVHWIDSSSLELLEAIAARVPHLRVLLCMTFRPEFQPPWTGQAHVTTLVLSRLDQRESTKLVSGVAGEKLLPPDIVDQIVERADGIPLFVEELTKGVLDSGVLAEQADRYVREGSLPPVAIPSSLYASLMARLDRLSPVKEIAQIGAAVGRRFSYELIAALAQRTDEQLRQALEHLVGSGLVFRRGAPPQESFIFKHALVQDAAYNSLLRRQRQILHARIAKVLETLFAETVASQPEILAHHYAQAGLNELAIDYWRKAGERALRRSANVEGVSHLTRAIELIRSLPVTRDRDRKELELHLALGQMIRATKGYAAPDTLRVFARARELLDGRASVNEQKTVLYGLWSVHFVRAEHLAAREVAQQCLELAERHRASDVPALAHLLMGCSVWATGEFADSRHHLEEARQLAALDRDDGTDSRFSLNNGIAALAYLAWVLWPLGHLDQAATAAAAAVERARRTGHVPLMAYVLYQHSFLGTAFGAAREALTITENAVAYCAEHRVTAYEHWARFCHGIGLARGGEPGEGIEVMRGAMDEAEKLYAHFLQPLHLGHLAAAQAGIGQPEAGLGLLDEAIHMVGETGEQFFEAELHRLKGETLLGLGNSRESEVELEHALAIARNQRARLWELRAATSLAGLWAHSGKRSEARDLLGSIYGWFSEGLDKPDLERARALLTALK
jgi:class 3 adenylate cyclase/tetratricopeptide (TPR) repeat protein